MKIHILLFSLTTLLFGSNCQPPSDVCDIWYPRVASYPDACNQFPHCYNGTSANTALYNALMNHVCKEVYFYDIPATQGTITNDVTYYFLPLWTGGFGIQQVTNMYYNFIVPKPANATQPPNVRIPDNFGPDNITYRRETMQVTAWNATTGEVSGVVIQEVYGNITYSVRNDGFLPGYVPSKPFRIYARWIQISELEGNKLRTEIFIYDAMDLIAQTKICDKWGYYKKYFNPVRSPRTWPTLFDRNNRPIEYRTSFRRFHDECSDDDD